MLIVSSQCKSALHGLFRMDFVLSNVTLLTVIVLVASVLLVATFKRIQFIYRVNKVPGVPGLPIIGNALVLLVAPEGMTLLSPLFIPTC